MPLSLKQSRAITSMARVLYDFLPGSGARAWKGHVTFSTVARKVGVPECWPGGSKERAIASLLENTLLHHPGRFEPLMLEIVRAGIAYRQKNGHPIRLEEIDELNGLLVDVGFKFRSLWDPEFRESLKEDAHTRARQQAEQVLAQQQLQAAALNRRSAKLQELKSRFFDLNDFADRNAAGLALEAILNELFETYELHPRPPFRIVGEQIDGSFELDHETYLLEAKWEKGKLSEAPLMVFREKVTGKSQFTRGMFVAINDVTDDAKQAICRGKQPNFFLVNGYDVAMLLSEDLSLVDYLRARVRLLGEGEMFVPYGDVKKFIARQS